MHRLLRHHHLFIFIVITLNQSIHRTNTLTRLPLFQKTKKKRSKKTKTLIVGCCALDQIVHMKKKIGREKWVGSLAKMFYKRPGCFTFIPSCLIKCLACTAQCFVCPDLAVHNSTSFNSISNEMP